MGLGGGGWSCFILSWRFVSLSFHSRLLRFWHISYNRSIYSAIHCLPLFCLQYRRNLEEFGININSTVNCMFSRLQGGCVPPCSNLCSGTPCSTSLSRCSSKTSERTLSQKPKTIIWLTALKGETSISALRPTQSPFQWVPPFFLGRNAAWTWCWPLTCL